MYMSAWVKFLSLLYGARLKGASPETLDPWVAKYVNDLRNGRRDLAADLEALDGSCRSRKTSLGYQSAIRSLLAREGLSLPPEGARRATRSARQPAPPVDGEALTPDRILRLMEHLDTRGRAILFVLVSSGARPGEVLSLRLGDLDLDARPARFRVRDERTGAVRIAFLSREAVGAIRVYLIVRDRFLASALSRGGTGDTGRLFPLGTRAFGEVWARALAKARLDRPGAATGRSGLTPRSSRRFFAAQMGMVLPEPVVRALMGRTPCYPYTGEELEQAYLQGERAVTLHTSRRGERVSRKIADLERLVGALQERVGEQERELGELRKVVGENPERGR
ncbi:MAG: site-specific integrase [Methanomicrobiales archaeon]|nr:site-specific integrase [Methanomicrobiales archaeon]